MARLPELQALFWRAITHPTGVADFLREADAGERALFDEVFAGTPELSAAERVDIYAESYYWRLHGVLERQIPVVRWLLGEAAFRNLTTDFVLASPSTHPDIGRFGAALPDFIAGHERGAERPELAGLARVEWTIVEVIDRRDEPALTREALAALAPGRWPQMRLQARATSALLSTGPCFPALCRAEREGRDPARLGLDPIPGEHTLIYRQGLRVRHRSVRGGEARALAAALGGQSFAAVCAAPGEETRPEQVVAWLGRWIDDGLFSRIADEGAAGTDS